MTKKLIITALLGAGIILGTDAKKVLDHTSFDDWKRVRVTSVSDNGKWAVYEINPQEGDGTLVFRNTSNGKEIRIPRGYSGRISSDAKWGVAQIKPFFKDTRDAKIKKKKAFEMPKDSLAIVNLATGNVEKIPDILSYKMPKRAGDWIAFKSADTAYIKLKALKDKECGRPLLVRHLPS